LLTVSAQPRYALLRPTAESRV